MKHLLLMGLLVGSTAMAQTAAPAVRAVRVADNDDAKRTAQDAKRAAEDAQRDTDEAKTRAKLDEARARLDKAAKEVAELSTQLGERSRRDMFFSTDAAPRGMLGVQVDGVKEGARVISVSPGGPAQEAGLRDGDIIVSLDGKSLAGGDSTGRALVDQMRNVKPDQKLKVRVLRAGKNQDFVVVSRPFMFPETRAFHVQMPDVANGMGEMAGGMPMMQSFHFFSGDFDGLELASITPKLGWYFGATSGVLVVQAPESAAFKLEEGDVIQSIDGRKPDDGAHALRILRSYKTGEKLNLNVLRQRKPITLAITMPDRPEFDEHMRGMLPPMPPMPPEPPLPGVAGPGTQE